MAKAKKNDKKRKGLRLTHYVLIVIAILLIVLGVAVYRFVFPEFTQDELYGRRDDNLYEIQAYDFTVLEDFVSKGEYVKNVTFDVKGAVIYALIDVEGIALEDLVAAFPVDMTETEVNDKLLTSYDFNFIFIDKNEVVEEGERASYPVIFYRNKSTGLIKWQSKNLWEYIVEEETKEEE